MLDLNEILKIIVIVYILVGGLLLSGLALFVYLRNKQSLLFVMFALTCLSLAVVLFSTFAMFLSKNQVSAIFWDRTVYVGAVYFPTLLYHFGLAFTRSSANKKLIVAYLGSTFFLVASRTNYFVSGLFKYYWGVHTKAQLLHHVYMIFFVVLVASFLLHILKHYKQSKGVSREQAKYVILAFIILLMIGPIAFLPAYGIAMYPFPYLAFMLFPIIIAYAIVRHRFMDMRFLILKSAAFTLSVGAIVGGYVGFTIFVLRNLEGVINPTIINMIALFVLLFTFQPLRKFIEQHTDKIFSKGRYNFRELLGKINDISNKNSRSMSAVTIKVMKALTEDMRIDKAAIVITSNTMISEVKALGYKSKSKNLWAKPVKIAAASEGMVVYDELEEDCEEKDILRKADIEVLIPILSEEEALSIKEEGIEVEKRGVVQAVLALGPKKSGDMYTSEDLKLLELVTPQLALAFENAKSFKEREQRITELKSINKMFQHIEQFIDLDKLLEQIVGEAINVTGAEGGSLMLMCKSGKCLSIKTANNLHPLISLNAKIKIGEGIAGHVAKTHEPIILNGLRDKRFRDHLKRYEIFSAISVPLITGDKLVGVLNVNRKKIRNEFSKENLNVMMAFAAQAAEAIEKAGYFDRIKRLSTKNDNQFKEFTKALAKTVDAKDAYTYGHSEAVTKYSLEIAKEMNFSETQLRNIEIGGRLHDMGKIGVPEHILNKAGALTDEEFEVIKSHPRMGAEITKGAKSLKDIRDLILHHHERFDGKGYPEGLKGKGIPLGARIMAVADAYDAMTSNRAYRKALPRKVAVAEIKKNSGTQFDPEIVDVFMVVHHKKRLGLVKNNIVQEKYEAVSIRSMKKSG